jgi:nucleoside-diphosphate-sugar epimerase
MSENRTEFDGASLRLSLGTVLVVGGSGWLGSFIVRRCLRLGIEARVASTRAKRLGLC